MKEGEGGDSGRGWKRWRGGIERERERRIVDEKRGLEGNEK